MSSASRRARQLADELGLALDTVSGTGPGGRITLGDVEFAALSRTGSPVEPAPAQPTEASDPTPPTGLPAPPTPPSMHPVAPARIARGFAVAARRTISADRLLERHDGAAVVPRDRVNDLGPVLLHAAAMALDRRTVTLALGDLDGGDLGLHVINVAAGTTIDEIAVHVATMVSDPGSPEGIVVDAGVLGVDEIDAACDSAWVCCAGRVVGGDGASDGARMTLTVTANRLHSTSAGFDAVRLLGRIADVLEGRVG